MLKKILIWLVLIVATMMLWKQPAVQNLVQHQGTDDLEINPLQQLILIWDKATNYQPEQLRQELPNFPNRYSAKEQRYINNISHSYSDLTLFMFRYCDNSGGIPKSSHITLTDDHLMQLCDTAAEVVGWSF